VPTFLQTVKAVGGFLDRAARHCAETGADPNDFVHARLFDDMVTCRLSTDQSRLRKRPFRDWLLTVVA
jgi:hypothetical protein